MDKKEAAELLKNELARYRRLRYSELVAKLGDIDCLEVTGQSGVSYQIEVQFMWDSRPNGDLRVMGGIDNGKLWSAFMPLCESFIMTPSGEFVEE